jgi:hypothetical protein
MKIPVFAGNTLADFLKSAKLVRTDVRDDGSEVDVYGTEVVAPSFCAQQDCDADEPLRCCGSYPRQVIEGVLMVLLLIYRFRCRSCGKTASCPYSFLVPYRRFTAKWICWGIELYGAGPDQTTYDEVSVELSTGVTLGESVHSACSAQEELEETAKETNSQKRKDGYCPARSTVFNWVDFACKRIDMMVQQTEKELVLRNFDTMDLPSENQFRNNNGCKAGKERYKHQQDKPRQLNKLSYGLGLGRLFSNGEQGALLKLRAYFFQSAERCADLLSDVFVVLPTAHTSEQALW